MLSTSTACRVSPVADSQVGDDKDQGRGEELSRRFADYTFHLICVGTIALIATSVRVWAGMGVIEQRITQLVESDNQQDNRIEQVRSELNNMRVQLGIIRAIQGAPRGLGRP